LALGLSFEEGLGRVRAAAAVKTQQDVIVAIEDRHAPLRCHQRCPTEGVRRIITPWISALRPHVFRRLSRASWPSASSPPAPIRFGVGGCEFFQPTDPVAARETRPPHCYILS